MAIKIPSLTKSGVLKVRLTSSSSWVTLPDPQSITWSLQDLDSESSGRDVNTGTMKRQRITTKRKLAIQWQPLNATDMSFILQNIVGANKTGEFQCQYFDAQLGKANIITCYTGDRTAPVLVRLSDGTYAYQSMSVDFIEC